ncbi:hypothetical protein Lalb_Chr02g0157311 [Lupinus albus]|uniref:Uncharacterized protein n=1 Tax=Lupinus albus TaxID=3870 RepID=A0A6A4R1J2_LUPAL|nr:hypothetical protein Lalb_Chr02g0157311 [Lupinus albus]
MLLLPKDATMLLSSSVVGGFAMILGYNFDFSSYDILIAFLLDQNSWLKASLIFFLDGILDDG